MHAQDGYSALKLLTVECASCVLVLLLQEPFSEFPTIIICWKLQYKVRCHVHSAPHAYISQPREKIPIFLIRFEFAFSGSGGRRTRD